MYKNKLGVLILLLLVLDLAVAEDMTILRKAVSKVDIVIDGRLDEPVWGEVKGLKDFTIIIPDSMLTPPSKTDLRLFYNDKGIYAGVIAHQPPETLVGRLTARDQMVSRDSVTFVLDTSGKGLYANWFAVHFGGSLGDGSVRPERQFTREWNGPWRGSSAQIDTGWSAEMFLPWSMLSMPKATGEDDKRRMGFYLSRKAAYRDEWWAYPALPRTQPKFLSALQGIIVESVNSGQQFSFQPFVSSGYDNIDDNIRVRYGVDLFWRPRSNLQLTAAIKPDFGTVESDDVVVNLAALEVFFSERRSFFLEGQDIFFTSPRADSLNNRLLLVNTRRIGAPAPAAAALPPDTKEDDRDLLEPMDLYGAIKLTGEFGNVRYGTLAAFEEDTTVTQFNSKNKAQPQVQRQVSGGSFAVARFLYEAKGGLGYRALGWIGTAATGANDNAYVQGIDAHYRSAKGAWRIDAQAMHSAADGEQGLGVVLDTVLVPRQGQKHSLFLEWYGEDLQVNDLGYMRRANQMGVIYLAESTQSNLPRFKELSVWGRIVQHWNNDKRLVRSGWFTGANMRLKNLQNIKLGIGYFPARWEDIESKGNGAYRLSKRGWFNGQWESNSSKKLSGSLKYRLNGESIGGWSHRIETKVLARTARRFSAEINLTYRKRNEWLLYRDNREFTTYDAQYWQPGLKLDYFFNPRSQLSTRFQWVGVNAQEVDYYEVPSNEGNLIKIPKPATSSENRSFTLSRLIWQVRYRWELAPLSELFIVYNRVANLTKGPDRSFGELFSDAQDESLFDGVVAKLRYRFGA